MKTTTKMSMAIMFLGMMFISLSGFAQDKQQTSKSCCSMKTEKKSDTTMQCPMKKTMTKADVEKMIANCPMAKGLSAEEKKKMISSCPLMKFVEKGGDTKTLTKEQMQKMMTSCPMAKNAKGKCSMTKVCSMKKSDAKAVGTPQTNCPVMKKNKINKNLYVDAEGKRIYVCCGACIAKVKADPKKYIKELEAQGVKLEDTPKK